MTVAEQSEIAMRRARELAAHGPLTGGNPRGGCVFLDSDGRIVAAARLYDGGARTSLLWLDPESGKLAEFLKLPSGGDTSYAGLVWREDVLWVSYYSSHEGKTAIYLAKVRL